MNNNTQTFEEKVRSMTASEIIMAMVEGLRNPSVEVDMNTFGLSTGEGICYGCAATNAICWISGVKLTVENIDSTSRRAEAIDSPEHFLAAFESAINSLRIGELDEYNDEAKEAEFAQIVNPKNLYLPYVYNDNYLENLHYYEQLAASQPKGDL